MGSSSSRSPSSSSSPSSPCSRSNGCSGSVSPSFTLRLCLRTTVAGEGNRADGGVQGGGPGGVTLLALLGRPIPAGVDVVGCGGRAWSSSMLDWVKAA